MRPPIRTLALPLAAAAALACNDSFTPQYRVEDLRILSIRTQAPPGTFDADAAPGVGTARIEALVVNPLGRAPVVYRWFACLPPVGEALPPCLDPAWLRQPERLAEAPGAILFAEGEGLDVVDLSLPDVTAALEAVAALARTAPAWACRPYAEVPVVLVVEADGIRQVAMRTIRVAATDDPAEYVLNGNPAVHEIRIHPTVEDGCDGVLLASECDGDDDCSGLPCVGAGPGRRGRCARPEPALPSGTFDLCAWPDWRKVQRYDECAPDGTRSLRHETPSWQWYVTAGTIEDTNAIGNATGERITLTRDGDGPFTIWVLVHDGRGGEGWMRFDAR